MKGNVEGGQKTGIQNVMDRGGGIDYPRYSLTLTLFVAGTAGRGWDAVVQTMVGGNTVGREGARKRKGKKKERPTEGFGV